MRPCVLLLNWNRWIDTIECLESLLRSDCDTGPVIVCDNDSQDGSLDYIRAWAEGNLDLWLAPGHALRQHAHPPVPKPIPCVEYDRAGAEAGGNGADAGARLILIRTGGNLGFAGGNNVGLRYVLTRSDLDCVWVLNNDTVVRPDALRRLVEQMTADPGIGICGSTLLYYDAPEEVQALGGASYNRWLALPKHIGAHGAASQAATTAGTNRMAYVIGASMMVRRSFLESVGLLSEDYFLYFEELDWVLRAGGRFRLGYAPGSVVYHKEGRSTGGTAGANDNSVMADYYFLRNRLRVTRRYFPRQLPTVHVALAIALFRRMRRNQWDRVRLMAEAWRKG